VYLKPCTGESSCRHNVIFLFQGKFLAFNQYSRTFNSDSFDYEELRKTDFVFMRWKEHFLVPDHTIKVEIQKKLYFVYFIRVIVIDINTVICTGRINQLILAH
jgi:hypothetical protein